MTDKRLTSLADELATLGATVRTDAAQITKRWIGWIDVPEFVQIAENLANCMALRRIDLHDLQRRMMTMGLSSLGRAESRVMPMLEAVRALLTAATGEYSLPETSSNAFFLGESLIAARADHLLGPPSDHSGVRLMVTLPSDAAEDGQFLVRLARLGVEAVRINCAHDSEAVWERMIGHVHTAGAETGCKMKVMMDLPGPKIRTGAVHARKDGRRKMTGDEMAITLPGQLHLAPKKLPGIECTLTDALARTEVGNRIYVDDGKLLTEVLRCESWGVVVRITAGPDEKGYMLKSEKGVNFLDAEVDVPALTDDDRAILPFVARHDDAIEFSFVQTA
jgi:pyruvate kinase